MKLKTLLLGATLFSLPITALAEQPYYITALADYITALAEQSYYIEGGLGLYNVGKTKANFTANLTSSVFPDEGDPVDTVIRGPVTEDYQYGSQLGFSAGTEIGIKSFLMKNLRVSVSLDYIHTLGKVKNLTGADLSQINNVLFYPNETDHVFSSNFTEKFEDSLNTAHSKEYVVLANAYYDFSLSSKIKPYLGVGAGIAVNRSKFSWGVTAGINYSLNEKISIGLKYRYLILKADNGISNALPNWLNSNSVVIQFPSLPSDTTTTGTRLNMTTSIHSSKTEVLYATITYNF